MNTEPNRLDRSPSSHSARKNMLSPDVDFSRWFLYIWGSWANSHDMILHVPRSEDKRARFVGTQVWKEEEM